LIVFNFHGDSILFKLASCMLDAPPAPNPGLDRLMAVKAPLGRMNMPN